jgi:chemotaxis family two-component system sensor histidine kinase/response regulator PixL
MPQDKELEIRRQFLDEAQEYLDALDGAILGLADRQIDIQKLMQRCGLPTRLKVAQA